MFHSVTGQDKSRGKEWKAPEKDSLKKSDFTFDEEAVKSGKETWSRHCKSCHGAKGLGDGPKAAGIEIACGDFSSGETQGQSDGSLFWKITKGRDPMPGFEKKLSDMERWQLVAFIRTLKKPAAPGATKEVPDAGTSPKVLKENKPQEKTTISPAKPDVESKSDVMKTDSINTIGPDYIELKNEIEMLKAALQVLEKKVDSLNAAKR